MSRLLAGGSRRARVVLALVLPLAAGVASAVETFPVDAEVATTGPVKFVGSANATAHLLGVTYGAPSVTGGVEWVLDVDGGRLRLVNFPYAVTGSRGGLGVTVRDTRPLPEEVLTDQPFAGVVELRRVSSNVSYRLLPSDPNGTLAVDLASIGGFSLQPPRAFPGAPQPPLGLGFARFERPVYASGRGGLLEPEGPLTLSVEGPLFALGYGGEFVLRPDGSGEREIATGERLNASRTVTDPSGTSGHWVYDRIVLVVDGPDVAARVRVEDVTPLQIVVAALDGRWRGDFEWAGVSGRVEVDGRDAPSEQALFHAIGDFRARADYRGEAGRWTVSGAASFVGVDGGVWVGDPAAHLGGLLPVVAAGAAVAAGFALWKLVAFLFTRLRQERLLEQPSRRGVYQAIQASPGVTYVELGRRLGLGGSTLRYQVGVLERNNLVRSFRVRGAIRLTPIHEGLEPLRRTAILEADPKLAALAARVGPEGIAARAIVHAIRSEWGLSRSGAWKVVDRAVAAQVLKKELRGREAWLWLGTSA